MLVGDHAHAITGSSSHGATLTISVVRADRTASNTAHGSAISSESAPPQGIIYTIFVQSTFSCITTAPQDADTTEQELLRAGVAMNEIQPPAHAPTTISIVENAATRLSAPRVAQSTCSPLLDNLDAFCQAMDQFTQVSRPPSCARSLLTMSRSTHTLRWLGGYCLEHIACVHCALNLIMCATNAAGVVDLQGATRP